MAITLNLTTGHKVTTIDSNQNKDKTFADVFNSYDADKNNALSSEELANMLGDNVKITKEGIFGIKTEIPSEFAAFGLMLPCLNLNIDEDEDNITFEEIEKFTGYSNEELSNMDADSAVEALIASSGFLEK